MSKFIDLTGKTYGRLFVVKRHGWNKHRQVTWSVKCQCSSKSFIVAGNLLRYGNTQSCGCLNSDLIQERAKKSIKKIAPGTVFGRWVVKKEAGRSQSGTVCWLVECNCGSKKTSIVRGALLRNGHSTSCGCTRSAPRKSYPFGWLGNKVKIAYKQGARNRKLVWEISDKRFYCLIQLNCFYCGSPPANCIKAKIFSHSRKQGYKDLYYSGIDRIDNLQGYTHNNTIPCCKICNAMKGKLSAEGFMNHIEQIHRFQNGRSVSEKLAEWRTNNE
jgi:hypothetical protein